MEMEHVPVYNAALRLLLEPKYHDVRFVCTDGLRVTCNRAYVAARCEYFDKLLYGELQEGLKADAGTDIKLQAPSAAVKHVLHYLHTGSVTGGLTAVDEDCSWITLLETCSLAQQYMLSELLDHISKRLLVDLPPESLGLALSFALKAQLQPVIKQLWVALPRLLPQPLKFGTTFSAEAICLCLQHTCWMAAPGTPDANSSSSSLPGSAAPNRDPGGAAGVPAADSSYGSCSVALREAEAYDAVIAWMLAEMAGCPNCQRSRQQQHTGQASNTNGTATISPGSSCTSKEQQHSHPEQKLNDQQTPHIGERLLKLAVSSRSIRVSNSSTSSSSNGAVHPGGWTASCSRAVLSPSRSCNSTGRYSALGTSAAGMSRTSSGTSAATDDTESGLEQDTAHKDNKQRPSSAPPAALGSIHTSSTCSHASCAVSSSCASAGLSCCPPAAAAAAVAGPAAQHHGQCCPHHETVLLQLLACLNWHLLAPSALEQLEGLSLLSAAALLDIYRALQRCSHVALCGSFPACLTATVRREGGGEQFQQGHLRCYTSGGEQVLECDSPAHITSTANLSFTAGKHCWQFVVLSPCDLVWVGLGDGSLEPGLWGGKQAGGWFYGSNDALCHNKHSDKHAYDNHCGHGAWGAGAVVDVCLDMDAREVWFGLNGGPLKPGFTGLPGRVYPAVSLRSPGRLLVRFRAASWLVADGL